MFSFNPAIPARSDVDWCWFLRRQGKSGEALERALHDIGVLDPGGWAAWDHSTLTATGSPVEMIFTADQADLQLITEVANPASDPSSRVTTVCQIMERFGATPPPAALRDVISAAQGAGSLQFGAWLGLRHGQKGLECLLYAELPSAAADLCELVGVPEAENILAKTDFGAQATMVVYDCSTSEVTLHFETAGAGRKSLPTLAEAAEVCPNVLAKAIDNMADQLNSASLPVNTLGFSFTKSEANTSPELTLYFSAAEAFATDARIARRIKTCGGHLLQGYAAFVDALQPAPEPYTHHGKIGLRARQNAAPILSTGVAAPWSCLFGGF